MNSTPALGNILIVDDDEDICELLQMNLRSEGYYVKVEKVAENVSLDSLADTRLIIVDAMKQDYSGMDLIFDVKDYPKSEHVGIILYSNIKSERMVIDALDAGADDYIVKPFSLRELLARVKSVLRRHSFAPKTSGNILKFHSLTVDPISQTVKLADQPLQLTKTEYAILTMLLKNVDSYVARVEIHKNVWNNDSAGANDRIVDTNISRLRKKLGNLSQHLISRTGHGYMLSTSLQ